MKVFFLVCLFGLSFSAQAAGTSGWKKISGEWSWMTMEENECWWSKMTILSSGEYKQNDCGKITKGRASKAEMRQLNAVMKTVLKLRAKKYKCSEEATQDYSWDYKITDSTSTSKRYFFNDGAKECYRGDSYGEFENLEVAVGRIGEKSRLKSLE